MRKAQGVGTLGTMRIPCLAWTYALLILPTLQGQSVTQNSEHKTHNPCPQPLMAARRARQSDRCQVGEVGADLIQGSLQEETVPVASVYGGGGVSRKIFHSGDNKVYLEISYHQ